MTAFCTLCGTTDPDAIGKVIGICLDAGACHRRQAERREYRAYVAEMIARAIEDATPEPGTQCGDSRNERVRYRQSRDDAAIARRMSVR